MPPSTPLPLIIFGPTGGVGLPTAIATYTLTTTTNTPIHLAMRDPTKPLPGLPPSSDRLHRIQADLTDPASVEHAARTTGAKHAFIYLIHAGGLSTARESILALKRGGVEFVVFLSSGSITTEDLAGIGEDKFASYAHARVEMALEEVFGGKGYVAVRPAWFASNLFWWRGMVRKGEVGLTGGGAKVDWIVPEDIGAVCGRVLVDGPAVVEDSRGRRLANVVYLHGPRQVSVAEAVGLVGRALGKDLKVEEVGLEEGIKLLVEVGGVPEFAARPVMQMMDRRARAGELEFDEVSQGWYYEEGLRNVERFTGRKPTELSEYIEGVKGLFE